MIQELKAWVKECFIKFMAYIRIYLSIYEY